MASDSEIERLARAASDLVEQVRQLTGESSEQIIGLSKRAKVNRRLIFGLWVSFLLDAALTILICMGLVQLQDVTRDVNAAQQLTQTEVLCPLYQQFVNADTPAARELARKNGQDLAARDEAFRVIHHSYDILDCKDQKRSN